MTKNPPVLKLLFYTILSSVTLRYFETKNFRGWGLQWLDLCRERGFKLFIARFLAGYHVRRRKGGRGGVILDQAP